VQTYGYIPYYPSWLGNGPQFVAPRAIGCLDEDAEAEWTEGMEDKVEVGPAQVIESDPIRISRAAQETSVRIFV
jgi:hypothetical protein